MALIVEPITAADNVRRAAGRTKAELKVALSVEGGVWWRGARQSQQATNWRSRRRAAGTMTWADGWTGGRADGRTGGRVDGRTGGWADRRTDGQTGRRADGRTGGRADGRTDGQVKVAEYRKFPVHRKVPAVPVKDRPARRSSSTSGPRRRPTLTATLTHACRSSAPAGRCRTRSSVGARRRRRRRRPSRRHDDGAMRRAAARRRPPRGPPASGQFRRQLPASKRRDLTHRRASNREETRPASSEHCGSGREETRRASPADCTWYCCDRPRRIRLKWIRSRRTRSRRTWSRLSESRTVFLATWTRRQRHRTRDAKQPTTGTRYNRHLADERTRLSAEFRSVFKVAPKFNSDNDDDDTHRNQSPICKYTPPAPTASPAPHRETTGRKIASSNLSRRIYGKRYATKGQPGNFSIVRPATTRFCMENMKNNITHMFLHFA